MFIIVAESQITGIVTYFTGQVISLANDKYRVEPAWDAERRFATRFATEGLADRIADAFRRDSNNVRFSVEYERE